VICIPGIEADAIVDRLKNVDGLAAGDRTTEEAEGKSERMRASDDSVRSCIKGEGRTRATVPRGKGEGADLSPHC
jgi:hypothetical protein